MLLSLREITVGSYNETAALMFNQEDGNHDGFLSTNETLEAFFKFDYNGKCDSDSVKIKIKP